MVNLQIPKSLLARALILLALSLINASCSTTTSLQINNQFPMVLAEPKPIRATILFDNNFINYKAQPIKGINLDIGTAQHQLFKNVFSALFADLKFIDSKTEAVIQDSLVIRPSVIEVQVSTPSDNYLNVFEVWIKYNLDIQTADGKTLTTWFMPAYGKTPESFGKSKSTAIENATITAIRDAGAKLMLDFYRIPAVHKWLSAVQTQKPEDSK
jgi:hypothetical protein